VNLGEWVTNRSVNRRGKRIQGGLVVRNKTPVAGLFTHHHIQRFDRVDSKNHFADLRQKVEERDNFVLGAALQPYHDLAPRAADFRKSVKFALGLLGGRSLIDRRERGGHHLVVGGAEIARAGSHQVHDVRLSQDIRKHWVGSLRQPSGCVHFTPSQTRLFLLAAQVHSQHHVCGPLITCLLVTHEGRSSQS